MFAKSKTGRERDPFRQVFYSIKIENNSGWLLQEMTTSFNLSRRPKRTGTDWSGFFRQGGVCPVGFTTEFVGHQDWKICRLLENECGETWQNGSANPATHTPDFPRKGHTVEFSSNLYGPKADEPQVWIHGGQIPYNMRKQLYEPRAYFDKHDYYVRKYNFDGTGYNGIRWWPQEGGKIPQYADDDVEYEGVWDATQSIQPYPMQELTRQGEREKWTTLTTRNGHHHTGCFYGDCARMNQFFPPLSQYQN